MKIKLYFILAVVTTIGLGLVGCKKDNAEGEKQTSVKFSIFSGMEYSIPALDNSEVEIYLSIHQVSKATGQDLIVWDTTYHKRPLKEYPKENAALMAEKMIKGIRNNDSVLKAGYKLIYTLGDPTAQQKEFTDLIELEKETLSAKIDVNLFRVDM